MDLPASVANKRLTSWLSPLDATLTKNRGYPHFSTFRCAWRLPRPGRGVPNGVTGRLDVRTSRSRDPAQIEAEEGVGIGIEADLGVGAIERISRLGIAGSVGGIGGAGRAGFGAGKSFVVNADVHGLDGAEGGIDEEGDGHGVEEGRRFLAPLVVEESEGVGERGALAEEEGAVDLVELQLGGVEGHDEKGHSCGEEFLGGGNVVEDVPFGLRGRGRAETEVAVAATDSASHQDDAFEFAESGEIFVDGGADIHQWADGDEGDLARVAADLVEEEGDGVGMRRLGEVAGFGIATLGESAVRCSGNAGGYGGVRSTSFGKEMIEKLGAGFRVAESGGDAKDLEFGAAKSERHGESVVDIVADVRVNDDLFGESCGGGRLGRARRRTSENHTK